MFRQALSASSRTISAHAARIPQRPFFQRQLSLGAPLAARRIPPGISQPSRWYSAEAEPVKESSEAPKGEPASQNTSEKGAKAETPSDPEAAQRQQLEAKDAEIRDLKDKYLRSVAEFRNLQDRTQREMKGARDYAIQKFAKDLVDSVDNLDRALAMVPQEKLKAEEKSEHLQDLVNLYDGLKMTENVLMQTLKRHGLERFDPNGEKFNPNEHEATFMTPMPDKEENIVFHTQQKGFKLNGRILRAAKVGVVKNK